MTHYKPARALQGPQKLRSVSPYFIPPREVPRDRRSLDPVKPRARLTQPLLYLAAGAIAAFSLTFFHCDNRETNTYVHAERGAVVHVVNGEPAGKGGR